MYEYNLIKSVAILLDIVDLAFICDVSSMTEKEMLIAFVALVRYFTLRDHV